MGDQTLRPIPDATVARLAVYLRALRTVAEGPDDATGTATISSERLAELSGVNAAMVRKDLSHLGSHGKKGVGYPVDALAATMARALGITDHRDVVIVGAGHLGRALAGYGGFLARGFTLVAVLDDDPAKVGTAIGDGDRRLVVSHVDDLPDLVVDPGRTIGVVAVPARPAQLVADRLIGAGVRALLNFAPVSLAVPANVTVREVDLAVELQVLAFHQDAHGVGDLMSEDDSPSALGTAEDARERMAST
jgi:redox-sensing transcriptional repressor